MKWGHFITWAGIAVVCGILILVFILQPQTRTLPEGYTYIYSPAGGHRCIVSPGGIKKVGQEVLDYKVSGTVVTGTVRLELEHDEVRSFRLDLKTDELTFGGRVPE